MRIIHADIRDTLFEVMAPAAAGTGYIRTSFRAAAVAHVSAAGEKDSSLTLDTGTVIPVALPYEKLREYVFGTDLKTAGGMHDLTPVTGEAACHVAAPELAKGFDAAAGKKDKDAPLRLRALLRRPSEDQHVFHSFTMEDLRSFETANQGKSICLCFRSAASAPFGAYGRSDAMLDMPFKDFSKLMNTTMSKGDGLLDLTAVFAQNPSYGKRP